MQKQKISLRTIKDAGLIPVSLFILAIQGIIASGLVTLLEMRSGLELPPWGIGIFSAGVGVPILFAYLHIKLKNLNR